MNDEKLNYQHGEEEYAKQIEKANQILQENYNTNDLNYLINHRCPGLLPIWNTVTKNYCTERPYRPRAIDCVICWGKSLEDLIIGKERK